MGQALLFYLFSFILVASAMTVIMARNTVYSVLFLIISFLNAAGLFVLLGAELLAMTLIIVYVGAVAILFLFVVMMLDINQEKKEKITAKYGIGGGLLGLLFFAELGLIGWYWKSPVTGSSSSAVSAQLSNAQAIGAVLYTDYILLFQLAGLILLVAMIGAIVLALRHRSDVRRQNPAQQLLRQAHQTLELKNVDSGKGIGR